MRKPLTQAQLDAALVEAHAREGFGQIADELRQAMTVLNLLDVRSMIEIGVENGGTLSVWQKLWDPLRIFAVDMDSYGLAGSREQREARWRSWMSPTQGLDVRWGSSHDEDTLEAVRSDMHSRGLSSVDLLFIDGDHTEAGAEEDFLMYAPLVREGGLVLFADIHDAGRPDMQAHRLWERLKPRPIPSQGGDRAPHPRRGWGAFDIFHEPGRQKGFGWGFFFV